MNSLAALFSFQGTDRPKATRRSPGELPFRDGLSILRNPRFGVNENLRQTPTYGPFLRAPWRIPTLGARVAPGFRMLERACPVKGKRMIGPPIVSVKAKGRRKRARSSAFS